MNSEMTLVAALKGMDGLVLAADSRATIGDPRGLTAIDDSHYKLFQLTKQVGVAMAGQADLASQLISEIRVGLAGTPATCYIDEVMQLTRGVCRTRYADWFSAVPVDKRPYVVFVLGGFTAPPSSEAKIYQLVSANDFAPQLSPGGHSLAGVPQYAIYLLHRLYRPDMQCTHLKRLAAYIISETASQDPKVGGPIRMATVTAANGYEEVGQDVIGEIVTGNESQTAKLQDFFFGR